MPQAVSGPDEPPAGLCRAAIEPGRRPLPQILRRVVKVQNARRMASEALLKQMPQSPCPITEPDHTGRVQDALAYGFEPQPRLEGLEITEDGHQPTLMQPGNDLACSRAMLAQAGQHAYFDLVPGRFAPGVAALGAKRDHHPIGPHEERSRRQFSRQRLLGGEVSLV